MKGKGFSLTCECGALLKESLENLSEGDSAVLICGSCYLNHIVKITNEKPVVIQRYYFPDD